jgi:hypothetical protein
LALFAPLRVTFDLAAEASGAEVRPLADVVLVLERTVLTGVPSWVVGAVTAPVLAEREVVVALLEGVSLVFAAALPAERVVPEFCLAAVLPELVVPVLRRAVVPVLPVLPLLPLVLRFTWDPVLLPLVLRFTWLPVVVPVLLPLVVPRRTWVEVLPEGAAVFLLAVEVLWRLAVVPALRVAVDVLLEAVELEEAALLLAVALDLLSEELEVEVVVVLRLAWALSSGAAAARVKTRTLASAILNVVLMALNF